MTNSAIQRVSAIRVTGGIFSTEEDQLVVEEPLEIRLQSETDGIPQQRTVSITMRTPGKDKSLALGFLFSEGILQNPSQVKMVTPNADGPNTTLVVLHKNVQPVMLNAERNFYISSSCGVCGKASIESIRTASIFQNEEDDITIDRELIYLLPGVVRKQQAIFESTGGLHAAALFSILGGFIHLDEDVGRHNALDKLIGRFFMEDELPLSQHILFLSGRASFELVQKAYMAGIKTIAAVGAPSSLAVELADSNNITLIGFLRDNKYNVYAGFKRIR